MKDPNWYELEDVSAINSPGLVFYEDRIEHNIQLLLQMIDDVDRLRPHVKTHKSAEVTELQLAAGITKFKCATIAEAEMLGNCKAPDVLLAYQPVGPNINRFLRLQEGFPETKFSCVVDNLEVVNDMATLATNNNTKIRVYIDVNVGMNRTGISPGAVVQLYKTIIDIEGLEILGLHAYDGHIHDSELHIRREQVSSIITMLNNLRQEIVESLKHKPVVIAGGTPGFPIYASDSDFECSPGTFVLWDKGYQDAFAEQQFLPAALIISRVISLPVGNLICTDLGHKAVSAENGLAKRITFLNAEALVPVSQSEEHLVLDAGPGHGYKVGDVLYGLPFHICPTVALHDTVLSVSASRAANSWTIASRTRKINL